MTETKNGARIRILNSEKKPSAEQISQYEENLEAIGWYRASEKSAVGRV